MSLLEEMSDIIGRVNIYDIYTPCYDNLNASISRALIPSE